MDPLVATVSGLVVAVIALGFFLLVALCELSDQTNCHDKLKSEVRVMQAWIDAHAHKLGVQSLADYYKQVGR